MDAVTRRRVWLYRFLCMFAWSFMMSFVASRVALWKSLVLGGLGGAVFVGLCALIERRRHA